MKQMEKNTNHGKELQKSFMDRCVQLRHEFSSMRVKHPVLIFMLIWMRFLLGTFFNVAVAGSKPTFVFTLIQNLWQALTQFGTQSDMEFVNLFALLFIALLYGLCMGSFATKNSKIRKNGFTLNLAVFVAGPIVTRYMVCLISRHKALGWSYPLLILAIMCLILGFILQLIFYSLALSSKMQNQNYLVCQKNFLILMKLELTNVVTIITTVLVNNYDQSSFCIIITGIHFVGSLAPIYCITREFIFHSEYSQFVYTTASCCEFSFSLIALICGISQDSLFVDNLELIILILSLFLYHGIKQYKSYRDNRIIIDELTEPRSLRIYLHIISCSLVENDQTNDIDFIVNVLRDRHKKDCQQSSCICQLSQSKREDMEELKKFLISTAIKKIMIDFQQDFQLNLTCSFFLLDYLKAFPDLLTNLNKRRELQAHSISAELEYQYFKDCLKKFLDKKKSQIHAIETQKIQEQDSLIIFLATTIKQILECKCQFWSNLIKRNPSPILIKKIVDKQTQLTQQLEGVFPYIFKDFLYSQILLEFISIYDFCIKLKNVPRMELKQAVRYKYATKMEASKISKGQSFKLETLLFEKNSVIFESQIEQNRMGIILNVTKNIEDVFGFKPEVIVGQNINEVMPKSMQKQHDVILETWRVRASWTNIHQIRPIFAMNKQSICFSTSIYLRIVQRMDSVNLLATFLKGNENDYLLINQDGVIDGVGLNFKKVLGNQIAKIPFSTICDDASTLFSEAKINDERRKITLTCYHTKGLEEKLELYQLNKFQIHKSDSEQNLLPEAEIKTTQRSLRIYASYEPYWMGRKFFVVLKFLSMEKLRQAGNESVKRFDANPSEYIRRSSLESGLNQTDVDKKIIGQYGSSIHTSNFGLSALTDTLFTNLQQKMKKNHIFANRKISLYLGVIFFCVSTIIASMLTEQTIELYFNDNFNDHSKESFRFFQKFVSLSLTHSRFLNIQSGESDIKFQIARAFVQLKRVSGSIESQHSDLWLDDDWGNPGVLGKTMPYMKNGHESGVVFEEYYNFYLGYCQRLYDYYVQKNGAFSKQFQFEQISQNQELFSKFINDNLRILETSILEDLTSSIILSRSIVGIFAFFTILVGYLVQKMQKSEQKHAYEVFNVYFSISDQNCEQCTNYYRKIISIFKHGIITYGGVGSQAKRVEIQLIEKNPLASLRKKLVQTDKFSRKKTSNISLESTPIKVKIIGYAFVMLIGILVRQVLYEQAHVKQTQFINTYFSIFNAEKQLINQFLVLKKITNYFHFSKNAEIQSLIDELHGNQSEEFMAVYFQLLNITKKLDPVYEATLQKGNQSLCQKIRQADSQYYEYVCLNNELFPYQKLKLFQAHSIVLQNMQNSITLIKRSKIADLQPTKLKITQDIINLNYIYLCNFLSDFDVATDTYHINKINLLLYVTIVIIFSLLISLLFIICFGRHVSQIMNRNCGRVLVIPELVLKSTKGAMRHIDRVLQTVE